MWSAAIHIYWKKRKFAHKKRGTGLVWYTNMGVSIKFEVGSWIEKNNQLYEQGAIRNLSNLGGKVATSLSEVADAFRRPSVLIEGTANMKAI